MSKAFSFVIHPDRYAFDCEFVLRQTGSECFLLSRLQPLPEVIERFRQEITMRRTVLLCTILTAALCGAASAAEIEVKMLNKGATGVMVFEPAYIQIQPGDSVKFVSTDKGHNAESIEGMLPDGAAEIAGKMGEDTTVAFGKAGVYGIRCKPHYGMGMVAMVVVGTPDNVDQAKAVSHPGKAKPTFAALFDKLSTTKTAGN
jgi:pseudoazurin